MPSYKLHYFPIRARGEVIRYVFIAAGVPYEENLISFEEWPKVKPTLLFGQVPVLEVDGKRLAQSNTIVRYLAGEFGLAGKNKWEAAECDMYSGIIEDIFVLFGNLFFEKNEDIKKEGMKKILEVSGPIFLQEFDRILSKSSSGYLVGKALTYADLVLLGGLEFFEYSAKATGVELIKKFPNLHKHRQKIAALPKIAAHISKRPESVFGI